MQKNMILISAVGLFFILLHVLGMLLPVEYFWGVNHWGLFPKPVIILFMIFGFFFCLMPAFKKISDDDFKLNIFSNKIYYAVIPFLSIIPFWFFRQKLYFLGDGYLWLRNLQANIRFRAQEPLEVFTRSVFYEFSKKSFNLSTETSMAILSVLCGIIFIFIALLTANILGNTRVQKTIIFLSLCTMGTIQLFFGYIETYSITTILILFFIFLSLNSLNKKKYYHISIFIFSLAVCAHLSAAAFFPAILYLFIMNLRERTNTVSKIKLSGTSIISGIIPLLLVILIFSTGGASFETIFKELSGKGHILPLFSIEKSPNISYSLFSVYHIIDIINEYILIAPLFFFAFFFIILNPGKIKVFLADKKVIFLFICSLSGFIFSFIFNMEIGASRDWDLFSAYSIPLTILSILIIFDIFKKRIKEIGILVIGCCILHTLPWVLHNSNRDYSLKQYLKLTKSETWNRHARSIAFDELRVYYLEKGDIQKALVYATKAYNIGKSRRLTQNMAAVYSELALQTVKEKKYLDAEKYFLKAYEFNPDDFEVTKNVGFFYFTVNNYDKAAVYYLRALEIQPDNVNTLRNTAMLFFLRENYVVAQQLLDRAIELNKEPNYHQELLNFKNALDEKLKEQKK